MKKERNMLLSTGENLLKREHGKKLKKREVIVSTI